MIISAIVSSWHHILFLNLEWDKILFRCIRKRTYSLPSTLIHLHNTRCTDFVFKTWNRALIKIQGRRRMNVNQLLMLLLFYAFIIIVYVNYVNLIYFKFHRLFKSKTYHTKMFCSSYIFFCVTQKYVDNWHKFIYKNFFTYIQWTRRITSIGWYGRCSYIFIQLSLSLCVNLKRNFKHEMCKMNFGSFVCR